VWVTDVALQTLLSLFVAELTSGKPKCQRGDGDFRKLTKLPTRTFCKIQFCGIIDVVKITKYSRFTDRMFWKRLLHCLKLALVGAAAITLIKETHFCPPRLFPPKQIVAGYVQSSFFCGNGCYKAAAYYQDRP